ncbi:MAG: D-alanyl-D-alanine carboxypeptidase family protein [Polyangiaceae bacterium]|nr:D-alanyl-D-alanine carboxypeptidase family protein [Polyangiaceae bacterium]MCW5789989.1 D-alanyl-D-alanine carboxypeptidase family protein [Polyangiaceae bacterium]
MRALYPLGGWGLRAALGLGLSALTLFVSGAASAQTVADIAARRQCSTAGLEGISQQLAETQMCLRPGAFVTFAPHAGITLSSSRIHTYLQASARDALWAAAARTPLTINSAFRTLADQYVLYHSGACALAAQPGRSNHQTGRAVDVQNYSAARSALESAGCVWLGASDPVHFDCPGTDGRADAVLAMQRLWNLNHPEDPIAEDGQYGPQTASRLAQAPAAGFPIGGCQGPEPVLAAELALHGSDLEEDMTFEADYLACAGDSFSYWFELTNTGDTAWRDVSGSTPGESVRLTTVGGAPDPLLGVSSWSLNDSSNPEVDPVGGDCNTVGCRRVRFEFSATAPSAPGDYESRWQLADGAQPFGAEVALRFHVATCEPAGGSGGQPGAGGFGGSLAGAAGSGAGGAGGAGGAMGGGSSRGLRPANQDSSCSVSAPGVGSLSGLGLAASGVAGLLWLGRRRRRGA